MSRKMFALIALLFFSCIPTQESVDSLKSKMELLDARNLSLTKISESRADTIRTNRAQIADLSASLSQTHNTMALQKIAYEALSERFLAAYSTLDSVATTFLRPTDIEIMWNPSKASYVEFYEVKLHDLGIDSTFVIDRVDGSIQTYTFKKIQRNGIFNISVEAFNEIGSKGEVSILSTRWR